MEQNTKWSTMLQQVADYEAAMIAAGKELATEVEDQLNSDQDWGESDPAMDALKAQPSIILPIPPDPAVVAEKEAAKKAELESKYTYGGSYIFDQPDGIPAIWGKDESVLWAEGEAFMIAGSAGLGKTTITGQLVRGLLGLQDEVLGMPVRPTEGRVLYLAMDRPRQIARSLRRHFSPGEREVLDERLRVWQGPPQKDMAQAEHLLVDMCLEAGASVVIVDSVKDAAVGLSEDAVGAGWNRAIQWVLATGIEVLELHHMIKKNQDGNRPTQLSEVYGSNWLTAGVGSVALLHGKQGEPRVKMMHLKQPGEVVGPWDIEHDHSRGVSKRVMSVDETTEHGRYIAIIGEQSLTATSIHSLVGGGKGKVTTTLNEMVDIGLLDESVSGNRKYYSVRSII